MLRYLKHKEINKKKWDACIDNSINALPYAYSWYLDVVTNDNWDAIILDEYAAVFPVPVKSYVVYKKVFQPFFTQQLGLFVLQEKQFTALPECIDVLKKNFKNIYLHLNTQNVLPQASKRFTHHLNLAASYESLYNNYSSTVTKNLKAFQNKSVICSGDKEVDVFIAFIKKHVGDKAIDLKAKDFMLLQHLVEVCVQKKKGFIRFAKNTDGEILSAAFFLHTNKYLIYLAAGSSPAARKLQSMTILMNSVIKEFANTETTLDFEGSMIPGIAQFYKRFGGMEISFPVLK